jgi:poly(U)-specific endoribonuclease
MAKRPVPAPTAEQLESISAAAQCLWDLDDNRMVPGTHYRINLQGCKKSKQPVEDVASQSLFEYVDKDFFFQQPTFSSFYHLLDNYEKATGVAEVETPKELQENRIFIDKIVETRPIRFLHKILTAKGLAPVGKPEFKKFLYRLWFKLYRRGGSNDSCGFEHVFVGEIKAGKVIGLHNWVQLFVEEQKGTLDYKGFVCPRRRGTGKGYKVCIAYSLLKSS